MSREEKAERKRLIAEGARINAIKTFYEANPMPEHVQRELDRLQGTSRKESDQ